MSLANKDISTTDFPRELGYVDAAPALKALKATSVLQAASAYERQTVPQFLRRLWLTDQETLNLITRSRI